MIELNIDDQMRCPHCDEPQEGTAGDNAIIGGWNAGAECEPFQCHECDGWMTTRYDDKVIVEVAEDPCDDDDWEGWKE